MAQGALRRLLWIGIAGLLVPLCASAQPATLVRDINTTLEEFPIIPPIPFEGLQAVAGRLFFQAVADGSGNEIWISDGTGAGTQVLRDLCPGPCDGAAFVRPLNATYLFSQHFDAEHDRLWRSDGTQLGTFPLTGSGQAFDFSKFAGAAAQVGFLGSFYFAGCTGTGTGRDCDLWRTDGTLEGTSIFQTAPRSFTWIQAVGHHLFYLASGGETWDLWVSDGTAAGTKVLHRFPGDQRAPSAPISVGERLFFVAAEAGEELWVSDGTAGGTRAVSQFGPAAPFPDRPWLRGAVGRVYFTADDGTHGRELWRSDGTLPSLVRLTDFASPSPFADEASSFLSVVQGRSIFAAAENGGPPRLWVNSGAPTSAAPLVLDCEDCVPSPGSGFVESRGRTYLRLSRELGGEEIWVTEGTPGGTMRISDRCADGFCQIVDLKGGLDGLRFLLEFGPNEQEVWFTDGTPAGTKPDFRLLGSEVSYGGLNFAEIPGRGSYFLASSDGTFGLWHRTAQGGGALVAALPVVPGPASEPRLAGAAGSRLLFTATEGEFGDPPLWLSAGTPETTLKVETQEEILDDEIGAVSVGGLVYFQTHDIFEDIFNLWRSDGTLPGTFVVAHLQKRAAMAAWQGKLTFFDGGWIWRTDGTVAGTVKTGDVPADLAEIFLAVPGPNGIYLKGLTNASGQVWISDGTTAGTRQLTHFTLTGVSGWPPNFTTVGSTVYFAWLDGLYKSDGTPEGTSLVQRLPGFEIPVKLAALGGSLVYATAAPESTVGSHLWRTDGTAEGTRLLGSYPAQDVFGGETLRLVPFQGKVFFNLDDGQHGKELMATDGTPAGTGIAIDLVPGPGGSTPSELTAVDGQLYFSAGEPVHGRELWVSDGTAAGSRLVQDIAPQAASSSPNQLLRAGDRLYFTADDGATGREVWTLPLEGSGVCQPSPTRLCLLSGRYSVEAEWKDPSGNLGAGHAVSLTADTGYFWFFDPANVEAALKVLDGRGVNGHVWVFYGALSNVEYSLTVTDARTGLSHRYRNPQGTLASVADIQAFGPQGASLASVATDGLASAAGPLALVESRSVARAATGACAPSSNRLCLGGNRYAVEIAWKDFQAHTGTATGVGLTADTGYFWFFDPANVEVVLKVLDGTAVNGKHWVFYGALSNVEFTVTVTDTQSGTVRTYRNPSGLLASVADTAAF